MRFALVVLVACSTPSRERVPVPPVPPSSLGAVDAPVDDAPADAAIDAADRASDAPTAQVPLMRCRDVRGPTERFPKCTEDGKVVELARPIVLAIRRHGASTDRGTAVVVEGGASRGIDTTWRATLIDARQREMVDATFSRLEPDEIEVLAPIAAERIDNFARSVQFTPPVGARLVLPGPAAKPDPVVLSIVRIGNASTRGTRIRVAGGGRRGIDRTWRIEVLDANQRPLPAGASFERVDADDIELVVRLTPDQLAASSRKVRFTPP